MASKFIAGLLAGVVVSGVGLGAASLMTPVPGAQAPQAGEAVVPAGSEFNQSRDDSEAALPSPEGTTEPADAPNLAAPAPDDLSGLEGADIAPGQRPEAGMAEGDLTAPEIADGSAGMAGDADDPVLPSPQSAAPEAPEGDDLSISTEPAQPVTPQAQGETSAFPAADGATEVETGGFAREDVADAATAPLPEDTPEAVELPEEATEPGRAAEVQEGEAEQAAVAEDEADAASGTIGNMAENVATGRLPSVGTGVEADAEDPGQLPDVKEELPAIEAHAMPFENPEGKPVMSIVLIDDGRSPIGLDALSAFPYPLSFAVDPADNGAADAMRRYREAGFEVLLMADLPAGASASDTETAMQAMLSEVPQAVAVLEGTGEGLQSSREAAEQLAPILLETGHGLVLFSKGLDTIGKLVAREGVPTATVFRDFDEKGQDATVIRRFLDQAAFKAGRDEGPVIMLGRLRAETVSALLIWGLQDRANRVALAPVSAALTAER